MSAISSSKSSMTITKKLTENFADLSWIFPSKFPEKFPLFNAKIYFYFSDQRLPKISLDHTAIANEQHKKISAADLAALKAVAGAVAPTSARHQSQQLSAVQSPRTDPSEELSPRTAEARMRDERRRVWRMVSIFSYSKYFFDWNYKIT